MHSLKIARRVERPRLKAVCWYARLELQCCYLRQMVDFHALANAVTGRLNIDVPPEAEVFVIAGPARFEIASLPVPAFALFLRKTREILPRK